MRQVPTFLVIGHGRVARHFIHYFSLLNIPCANWHRGMSSVIPDADRILVLISDRAIESFIDEHLADKKGIKIHFSGALVTDKAYGVHPLMTFGPEMYDLQKYQSIPFVVDDDAPAFEELLPGFSNMHARLSKEQKTKYHAICCMAGNYMCLLWQKLFDTFENEFHLPPEIAHAYLRQQTDNLITDYKTALTGPLSRGDMATVEKHIKALQGDNFAQIYESFVKNYKERKP